MGISIQKSNHLKSIAILMMLFLHLFNRNYENLFQPLIFLGEKPLSYYLSLFCDACVPIFAFVSGYGLYFKYKQDHKTYMKTNWVRAKKIYINYWVVLLLFAILLGSILGKEGYPGNVSKILLNVSGLDPSYNGAWWFFTIYIYFIFTSQFWFSLLEKITPYLYFSILLIVYFVAFYFRVYKNNLFDNSVLSWFHKQLALYFCTLFQFMLGAFVLKYKWIGKTTCFFQSLKYKNLTVIIFFAILIFIHSLIPNFIIAPFIGLAFIILFIQLKWPVFITRTLDFFSVHSTNMWLTHMFFYMIFFSDFVYGFKYVPFIFLVLIILCLISSYIVNFINCKIQ